MRWIFCRRCRRRLFRAWEAVIEIACPRCGHIQAIRYHGEEDSHAQAGGESHAWQAEAGANRGE